MNNEVRKGKKYGKFKYRDIFFCLSVLHAFKLRALTNNLFSFRYEFPN